jgi:capsid protein
MEMGRPEERARGGEKEVQLGLNSRKRGAAEQGNDYEEIVDELAEEEEYADDAGVDVSLVSPATKALPPGAPHVSENSDTPAADDTSDSTDTNQSGAGARRLAAVS